MRDLIQDVTWPGVLRVESFTYSCSHGITPGVAVIVTAPQGDDTHPAAFGDLVFTDGFRIVTLGDCHAFDIQGSYDITGITYTLMIHDRRWRLRNQWGGFGGMRGRFNRVDARGKLVPWSIRSPMEIAAQCMREMGQANNRIILPDGIPRAAGQNVERYLRIGENFPMTKTNPYVEADYTPPAEVLSNLADSFGCRVVYQPILNRLAVLPQGFGRTALPDFPYEMAAPNVTDPETPVAVGVFGGPLKIQSRWAIVAVGKEWDGSWLPINMLSYAPKNPNSKPQISEIATAGAPAGVLPVRVSGYLEWSGGIVYLDATGGTAADVLTALKGQIEANADAAAKFTTTIAAGTLTVIANDNDTSFTLEVNTTYTGMGDPPSDLENYFAPNLAQKADKGGTSWEYEKPGIFSGVRATDRLSYSEARALAVEHVFKTYRVILADPNTRKPPMQLPAAGEIKRIQQVTILPSKVEQVVPQARIAGGVNRGNVLGSNAVEGQGVLPEFYNGQSRDQSSTVTGSVWKRIGSVSWWLPGSGGTADDNTLPTDRVWVGHSVRFDEATGDTLVTFGEYVYRYVNQGNTAGFLAEPELTLETAAFVTDDESDQFIRYEKMLPLAGGVAPPQWHAHPDLQLGIIATYKEPQKKFVTIGTLANGAGETIEVPDPKTMHIAAGFKYGTGDEAHVNAAADDYLTGHARKFVATAGETRQYIGIIPIDPDGAIHQVTWSIGPNGPTTTVSTNSEHSPVIQTYPARRRDEMLPPNKLAAAANLAERASIDRKPPSAK